MFVVIDFVVREAGDFTALTPVRWDGVLEDFEVLEVVEFVDP